jgi:hypothetical protein
MTNASPSMGMAGRGLATFGALLWILSMFLTFYSRGSQTANFWELQRYTDVVTFVLAVVVLLIVAASVFLVVGDALLPAVAVIGGYLLALDVSGVIEARDLDIGAGGYVGILGAVAITAGVLMAIVPALAESAARGGSRLAVTEARPVVETSHPVIETIEPVVTTSYPMAETSYPVAETSYPVAETIEPVVETRDPVVETSDPLVQTSQPSAGWYADPSGEARLRYWDGSHWSDSTRS